MGCESFTNLVTGTDADTAFQSARDDALYEYGHGGYTGTIAEKGDFKVVTTTPMGENEASTYAEEHLDDADKWGPALAIPVVTATHDVMVTIDRVTVPTGDHQAQQEALVEEATKALRAHRGLRRGEKVTGVSTIQYEYQQAPFGRRVSAMTWTDVRARVTIARPKAALTPERVAQSTPDAWLFFGHASS